MADLMPCYGGRGTVRIAIVFARFSMRLAHKVKKLCKPNLNIRGGCGE